MLLLFLLTGLIGGTAWVFLPLQLRYLPFEFVVAYRFLVSGLLLLVFSFFKEKSFPKISYKNHGLLGLQGVLFFGLNHMLCAIASRYIPSGLIAVSVSLMIIPNALLGHFIFCEPITSRYVVGAALGIIGVLLAFSKKTLLFSLDFTYCIGFLLAFSSTFLSATGTILSKKLAKTTPILFVTAYSTLYGGIFSFVLGIIRYGKIYISFAPEYLLSLLYVTTIVGAFVSVVYFYLVTKEGASRASYLWLITPVVSVLMSQLFEGFQTHAFTWFGLLLVIGGLYLCINKNISLRNIFSGKKTLLGVRIGG